MTRETKIGLLVGLAFVIVVGILLSDHLSAASEPAAAPLRLAGDTVRTSLGETTVTDFGGTLRIPPGTGPTAPLLTAGELAARTTAGQRPPVGLTAMAQGDAAENGIPHALRDLARRGGEEVVPTTAVPPAADDARRAPPSTSVAYKAEQGDTLGTIAAKLLGANTKANRDRVVAANATLQANPNRVVVGRSYAAPTATPALTPAGRGVVQPVVSRGQPTTPPAAPAEHYRHGRHVTND